MPGIEWLRAFHIIFMVTWFAGLFYLPRLFVYHASATDQAGIDRFCVMERKLFVIMSIGAIGTLVLGLMLLAKVPAYMSTGWMHAKLALVIGLLAYHVWLGLLCRRFRLAQNQRSEKFYRLVNELPALFLVGIVILVVVKPF